MTEEIWEPFKPATMPPMRPEMVALLAKDTGTTEDEIREAANLPQLAFLNNLYQVNLREVEFGGQSFTHLSIKRLDKAAVHDWRHFQRIKNEICGPEREAIELYPAESRLVDTANQYHLWVLPEGNKVGCGWTTPLILNHSSGGAVQRPREDRT